MVVYTKLVHCRLQPKVSDRLDLIAQLEGVDRSKLIRDAIEAYIRSYQRRLTKQSKESGQLPTEEVLGIEL
jgi:metal-responsive CopG/Arc/MetJ family transcriptional regulator